MCFLATGDYRIPKEALTTFDGTRLSISVVAPHKGIVRGTRNHSICSWYADWNAYKCNSDDYRMLVIESLDADTETRRLSPVALIANGEDNLTFFFSILFPFLPFVAGDYHSREQLLQ